MQSSQEESPAPPALLWELGTLGQARPCCCRSARPSPARVPALGAAGLSSACAQRPSWWGRGSVSEAVLPSALQTEMVGLRRVSHWLCGDWLVLEQQGERAPAP